MLVSEIISLQVVSIWNKSFEGIVENLLFENKTNKLKYLKVYNENDNSTYFIKPSNIYKLSPSTILIKNNSLLCPATNLELSAKNCFNPIGSILYDFDGNERGLITDLEINSQFKLCQIISNKTIINIENILTFGTNITFLKSKKNIKLSTFSPNKKIKISKNNISVKNLDDSNILIENINIVHSPITLPEEETKKENLFTKEFRMEEKKLSRLTSLTAPKRIITDYRFLLNRMLSDNIILSNGEVLIRKGSKINSKIIEKARTFGKLVELTQKSK